MPFSKHIFMAQGREGRAYLGTRNSPGQFSHQKNFRGKNKTIDDNCSKAIVGKQLFELQVFSWIIVRIEIYLKNNAICSCLKIFIF